MFEVGPSPSRAIIHQALLSNGFERETTISEADVLNFLKQNNYSLTTQVFLEERQQRRLISPRFSRSESTASPSQIQMAGNDDNNNGNNLLSVVSRFISSRASPSTKTVLTSLPFNPNASCTRNRIQKMKFGGHVPSQNILSKKILTNFKKHARIMGHTATIYCVTYDHTGKYIITGSEDHLIKVWNAETCLLRYTFRGHTGAVWLLSVSFENTLLASGSNDKSVRVWCMQNGELLHVFTQHTGQLASVCFPDFFQSGIRYLVSAATDCSIIFYRWKSETREFLGPGERFIHKEGRSGQFSCTAYTSGGNFAAFAGTQKIIYIYKLEIESVSCIATLNDVHTGSINTIAWAFSGIKFVTGGKDGRAFIWEFELNTWKQKELTLPEPIILPEPKRPNKKSNTYIVKAAAWTQNDAFIFTTGSDNCIQVWNPKNGNLVASLKGHTKHIYDLLTHPINSDLMISAGTDGISIIWDVSTLSCIKRIENVNDALENQNIYAAALSLDGTLLTFVDETGHLTINGICENEIAKKVPKEQFFDSDYYRCSNDARGYSFDVETRLATHLFINFTI